MARTLAILSLALAATLPRVAHAQTPDSIVSTIDARAAAYGLRASCMEALAWSESRDDPEAVNPVSGAAGLAQFTPSGVWTLTPEYAAGVSPLDASAAIEAASWLQARGYGLMGWGRDCR